MELTKEEARVAKQKAIRAATRKYFAPGEGATDRRYRFAKSDLKSAVYWSIMMGAGISLGAILAVTASFGHEQAMAELHAWMLATPVEQVIDRTHGIVMRQFWNCLTFGFVAGILQSLVRVSETGQTHE